MKSRINQFLLVFMLTIWGGGCAILQRESPEKKAKEVILAFQQSLTQSDADILKFFNTDQSRESLFSAITILQNKDNELVECVADFNNMTIDVILSDESMKKLFNDDRSIVQVTVPTVLKAQGNSGTSDIAVNVSFLLTEKKGKFVIYKLNGEEFYNQFTSFKHDIQYASQRQAEIKEREAIYATADKLKEKYDHVVWFARYNDQVYFYVVNGDWNEESLNKNNGIPQTDFKMGLLDKSGNEIIPVEFKMIGTIGAEVTDAVEVKSVDGYGYFTLKGDTLVPPLYAQIIPYPKENFWVVQSEGEFGWIDNKKNFVAGFPNHQIEKEITQFSYLPSGLTIDEGSFSLCESPFEEGAGSGLFISPSYWVESGLFDPFKSGIQTTVTDAPIGGWTEYIEIGETLFSTLTDQIGVLIGTFKERYLEGREEFYESKKLIFKDSLQSTIQTVMAGGDDLLVKPISDNVIEVSSTISRYDIDMMGPPENGEVVNPRNFTYYAFHENTLEPLNSHRYYNETEFVKLDSSYITGSFRKYNMNAGDYEMVDIVSIGTLQNMRNEILADYGYIFPDEAVLERFKYNKWYSPRFETEQQFEEQLSDIDRYNLIFLAKIIRLMQESEGDV